MRKFTIKAASPESARVNERRSLSDRVWDQLGEAAIALVVLSVIFVAVMTMLEPM